MSKTILKVSEYNRQNVESYLKCLVNDKFIRFYSFEKIEIEATLTSEELKKVAQFIEDVEAHTALDGSPFEYPCIECGKKDQPIIKQCEKCGAAIRACCPDHEKKC